MEVFHHHVDDAGEHANEICDMVMGHHRRIEELERQIIERDEIIASLNARMDDHKHGKEVETETEPQPEVETVE